MKIISVKTEKHSPKADQSLARKDKRYPIYIGVGLISKISELIKLRNYSKVVVLTDENVAPLWLKKIGQGIDKVDQIIVKPGENEKNIETVQMIWKKMLELGVDRKSLLINLGGGVIGDMGGFAASTYMRGIEFVQVPTTLLSQVDASVGGKVGIDFNGVKNIVGSFQQPIAVIIDISTLSTLPEREFISGFAEIIKHGLIKDKKYLEFVTSKKLEDFSERELIKIIYESCKIKARVVEQDEKEGGLRKILNFGHTIGHAVESISLETKKPLLHGEAISIGMVAEAKISQLQGHISNVDVERIKAIFNSIGLPTSYSNAEVKEIIKRVQSDKKNVGSKIKWSLLEKIGRATFDKEVPEQQILEAINFIK